MMMQYRLEPFAFEVNSSDGTPAPAPMALLYSSTGAGPTQYKTGTHIAFLKGILSCG